MYSGVVCDFPGCGNPISARCHLCGRSMCIRHIQWIDLQGGNDLYGSHYRCDVCSQPKVQVLRSYNTKARMKHTAVLLGIAILWLVGGFLLTAPWQFPALQAGGIIGVFEDIVGVIGGILFLTGTCGAPLLVAAAFLWLLLGR